VLLLELDDDPVRIGLVGESRECKTLCCRMFSHVKELLEELESRLCGRVRTNSDGGVEDDSSELLYVIARPTDILRRV